jgi:tRNA modification GTPase
MSDTIFALASAPGRAGVAVIRISGPGAAAALRDLAGSLPPPRRAVHRRIRDPRTAEIIDDGIALYFAGPASVTGEDVAEFQLHGGRAVLKAVLAALGTRPGFRMAEPGEFTRRAFLNGKFDLTAAEAVADLVAAETAAQRRQALRQLGGEFGRLCEAWREGLIRAQARLEAEIDFPEEGLPQALWAAARDEIKSLSEEIARQLADDHRGERLRAGLLIAILGPPNAGKSTLMNALAQRDVAITSSVAGTTRDVIEVELDLGGYPVVLADTAGLRAPGDAIEEEGIRRARARAESADLRLAIVDASKPEDLEAVKGFLGRDTILVANKIDIATRQGRESRIQVGDVRAWPVSVLTGVGMSELIDHLTEKVSESLTTENAPLVTRLRHRDALETCLDALDRFQTATLPELAAEDLRAAARALGRITGRVDVDDVLDSLFKEFCIGK